MAKIARTFSMLTTAAKVKNVKQSAEAVFDTKLLDVLVCPLSKEALRFVLCYCKGRFLLRISNVCDELATYRFDEETSELISDSIGVTYKVTCPDKINEVRKSKVPFQMMFSLVQVENGVPNLNPWFGRIIQQED